MAFTQADIDTIDLAIASSTLKVRFSDGKEVTYHDIDKLITARNYIERLVNGDSGSRVTYAQPDKD